MTSKTTRIGILFITICLLSIGAVLLPFDGLAISQENKEEVLSKVYMFDIGQGDSFFIETKNGKQILIDGGRGSSVLGELSKVMSWNDKSIDIVLATHPDADHIGGLDEVLKRYKVDMFLTSEVGGGTKEYKGLMSIVNEKKIPAYFVRSGMRLDLSDTEYFLILFPDRDVRGWDPNTGSVVAKFVSGNRSVLFTGDSPISVEEYLSNNFSKDLDIDILKIGHHGSKTSTSTAYLRATSPALALISAGKNNTYGHPNEEVLVLLKKYNIPFVSTQSEGTVLLKTDGVKWYK
jgi:competence protein ComEC